MRLRSKGGLAHIDADRGIAGVRRKGCRHDEANRLPSRGAGDDMAKNNKDRHASHRVASFLAGMTG